ncbi:MULTISPECIES: AbrB/MazE/SpoVT family DNA-binding domain-containing protein [Bacillus]|uniref:AbrB/MazE/SpoVT family DNA-binding domain-containing protein n=1 Tax=Bacillus TaxID=1386 RepID=UPI000BB78CFA|nr:MULTISPECIES: AbrB/MazE/SpoVT family DNA-binding domain-containing protein [Bacillus]
MISLAEHRRMRKSGHVTIPSIFRKELNIKDGDVLMIKESPKGIVMKRAVDEHPYNESIVSNNGKVNIPVEIRRNLKIGESTDFKIKISKEKKEVIFTKY